MAASHVWPGAWWMQMFSMKTAFSSSQKSRATFPTLTPKLPIQSHPLFLTHFPRRHEIIYVSPQKFKWLSLDCHKGSCSILSRPIQAKYIIVAFKGHGDPHLLCFESKTWNAQVRPGVAQVSERQLIPRHQRGTVKPASAGAHFGKDQARESSQSSNPGAEELRTGDIICLRNTPLKIVLWATTMSILPRVLCCVQDARVLDDSSM